VSYAAEGAKRALNLTVSIDLFDAARAAGINLSGLFERALTEELARLRARQWREENALAVVAFNTLVERSGTFFGRKGTP
jgi:antitoxin CcdA